MSKINLRTAILMSGSMSILIVAHILLLLNLGIPQVLPITFPVLVVMFGGIFIIMPFLLLNGKVFDFCYNLDKNKQGGVKE